MYTISMEINNPTIGSLVWHLALKWRTQVDRAVARFDLTHAQYSALASLYTLASRTGAPSQRELADYTGLQPIFMSKLVKALEAGGLIARKPDDHDTRTKRLGLTAKGEKIIVDAMAIVRSLDQQLSEPLGGRESERTRQFANTLKFLLDQPIDKGPSR